MHAPGSRQRGLPVPERDDIVAARDSESGTQQLVSVTCGIAPIKLRQTWPENIANCNAPTTLQDRLLPAARP